MTPRSSRQNPRLLEDRLRARRSELEQGILVRIKAISDPTETPDPAYLAGLRGALAVALDYGIAALAAPNREPGPVPVELLAQARRAARNGVGLEAVLRRYSVGHSLLADTLLDEAAAVGAGAVELKSTLRALAAHYDRIVATVSEEYGRENTSEPRSAEQRRFILLRRVLSGEPLDAVELGYEFNAYHVALVASGRSAADAIAALSEHLDRHLLRAESDERTVWAWLGGRRRIGSEELGVITSFPWPAGVVLACGEPGQGLYGWRFSHRQAAVALAVAQRGPASIVHYADVALLSAVLQDDLLATSLRQGYLAPLEEERKGGAAAKETLRAYFAAAGNISAAAAALGVNRRTVSSRLARIERRLERPLMIARAEIEVALRLDALESPTRQPAEP
jgi:hypothetical protein